MAKFYWSTKVWLHEPVRYFPFNYEIIDHEIIRAFKCTSMHPEFWKESVIFKFVIRSDKDDDDIKEWFTVAF